MILVKVKWRRRLDNICQIPHALGGCWEGGQWCWTMQFGERTLVVSLMLSWTLWMRKWSAREANEFSHENWSLSSTLLKEVCLCNSICVRGWFSVGQGYLLNLLSPFPPIFSGGISGVFRDWREGDFKSDKWKTAMMAELDKLCDIDGAPEAHPWWELCRSVLVWGPRVSQAARYKHCFRFYLMAGGIAQRECVLSMLQVLGSISRTNKTKQNKKDFYIVSMGQKTHINTA